MWSKEVTIQTNASREQIWELWADVKNWNIWDPEVKYSEIFGEFTEGTRGIIKPINGPKSKFIIFSVDYLTGFSNRSFLPFAKIDFIHKIFVKNEKIYLTHKIEIRGFLSIIFSRIIGEKLIRELPKAMNKLSQIAEKI
ncbi:MAG: SRPBCC family protein [Ignavibacteriaceae bacterium]